MKIQNSMSIYEKLNILSDAAKYDVACTSSGTKRKGDGFRNGKLYTVWNLPQFFCRWQMYFTFKNPVYE